MGPCKVINELLGVRQSVSLIIYALIKPISVAVLIEKRKEKKTVKYKTNNLFNIEINLKTNIVIFL